MDIAPFTRTWEWLVNTSAPFRGKKPMNFITVHYLYMLAACILGSIMIFPGGGIAYIDTWFFSMGAVTQSGLNTVDVNSLFLYQQIVIYFLAMLTNPITINTFVVFVRLYWFEKRFQHVVKQSMEFRRSRTRSMARNLNDKEPGDHDDSGAAAERGVGGRNIVVLRDSGKPMGPNILNEKSPATAEVGSNGGGTSSGSSALQKRSSASSDKSQVGPLPAPALDRQPSVHRNITFADEVASPPSTSVPPRSRGGGGGGGSEDDDDQPLQMPDSLPTERHIAFLENQRNPKDKGTLRIPGPRESDLGQNPETVNEGETDNDDHLGRTITIEESERGGGIRRAPSAFLNKLSAARRAGTSHSRDPDASSSGGGGGTWRLPTILSSGRTATRASRAAESAPYLSWQPTIGRNSAFIDLTEEQREELGGVEYRSLKTLAIILVAYFVLFHLLGIVTLLPWIVRTSEPWGALVDAEAISRVWWGIFTPATLFNDLGFTLTPDSMISFQGAVLPLLLGSFLIIIGNTGFPCMLRFVIWAVSKFTREESPLHEELRFLLDHPRRCFTLLFPSEATWVLFTILVFLNGIDLLFFIVLDLQDDAVTSIPPGLRWLNGLFQAASTRTAGTAVVNLSLLHPAIQVSYLIMMYISVFPIAISVRRTNVYEEKSLGIYGRPSDEDAHDGDDSKEPSYIGAHLRRQLEFDLWFIFLGLFIIAIAEGPRIQTENSDAFSLFSCLFEIVSAYGTVGLSLGYTDINASFSAEFTVVSKLVITAMMLRGRHRGLPYELDRAILLPNDSKQRREDEDAARRILRRNSSFFSNNPSGVHLGPAMRNHATRSTYASGRDDHPGSGGMFSARPSSGIRSPDTPATAGGGRHHLWPTLSPPHPHLSPHLHPPQIKKDVGQVMAGLAEAEEQLRPHESREGPLVATPTPTPTAPEVAHQA